MEIKFHDDWRNEWREYVKNVPRGQAPLENTWDIGRDTPEPYPTLPIDIPISMAEFVLSDRDLRQSYIDADIWFKKEVDFDIYGEGHPMYSEKPDGAFRLQNDFYDWCTWKVGDPVNREILGGAVQLIVRKVMTNEVPAARSHEAAEIIRSNVYGKFFEGDEK